MQRTKKQKEIAKTISSVEVIFFPLVGAAYVLSVAGVSRNCN